MEWTKIQPFRQNLARLAMSLAKTFGKEFPSLVPFEASIHTLTKQEWLDAAQMWKCSFETPDVSLLLENHDPKLFDADNLALSSLSLQGIWQSSTLKPKSRGYMWGHITNIVTHARALLEDENEDICPPLNEEDAASTTPPASDGPNFGGMSSSGRDLLAQLATFMPDSIFDQVAAHTARVQHEVKAGKRDENLTEKDLAQVMQSMMTPSHISDMGKSASEAFTNGTKKKKSFEDVMNDMKHRMEIHERKLADADIEEEKNVAV
jgi:hypothetical protein